MIEKRYNAWSVKKTRDDASLISWNQNSFPNGMDYPFIHRGKSTTPIHTCGNGLYSIKFVMVDIVGVSQSSRRRMFLLLVVGGRAPIVKKVHMPLLLCEHDWVTCGTDIPTLPRVDRRCIRRTLHHH